MAEASDPFYFSDLNELWRELRKRLTTSEVMLESQPHEVAGHLVKAFGYPFTGDSLLYGPRVNYAARDYWTPAVPDRYAVRTDKVKNARLRALPLGERCKVYSDPCGDYEWALSDKGKKDPHSAIINLFVPEDAHKRTLIHCDYLVSLVHFRSFAAAVGKAEFVRRLTEFGLDKIRLKWNAFADLNPPFLWSFGGMGSLRRVRPSSQADLVIGDHVVFFNHVAYDPLNEKPRRAWRLENAVLIDRTPSKTDIFLGHGSGQKTANGLRERLAWEYNQLVAEAVPLTRDADSKNPATRAKATASLTARFPNIQRSGAEWHIRGTAFDCKTVDVKLGKIAPSDVVGLRDACDQSKMGEVERPIESAK